MYGDNLMLGFLCRNRKSIKPDVCVKKVIGGPAWRGRRLKGPPQDDRFEISTNEITVKTDCENRTAQWL